MSFLFLKNVKYANILRGVPILRSITRLYAILWVIYAALNVIFMTLKVTLWLEFSSRAAVMSLINIVPLLCGPRLLLITRILGFSLST